MYDQFDQYEYEYDEYEYDQTEFLRATRETLTAHGMPEELAARASEILDRQNLGLLPCPLEEPELGIVRSAWLQTNPSTEEVA